MSRRPASSFEYLRLERRTPVCASPSRPPSSRACGPRCARPASSSTVRRPSLVRPRCIRPTYATHVSKTSTRAPSQCRLVRDCSRERRTVRFTSPGPLRRPSFRRIGCFRPAAPVVPPRALSSSLRPVRRLGSDIPVAFRLRRAFELSLAPAVCERPRPRPPRLRERAAACSTRDAFHPRVALLGLGPDHATLPPRPGTWCPFALRGRPLRASRPSACPAATGLAFGRQTPLADFCNCDWYGHTGDRPIPASKRARERLVPLRPASCPAKREQATLPRRSAAAPTEVTSSQRPRCGG